MKNKLAITLSVAAIMSAPAISSEYMIVMSAPGLDKKAETPSSGGGIRSCLDILKSKPSTQSGPNKINPDGKGELSVYCDMSSMGGGWTLIDVSSARAQKSLVKYASLAKISTDIAFGNSMDPTPTLLTGMKYGVAFKIPDPSVVTFDNSVTDARDAANMQLISKFGIASGNMILPQAYYASKKSMGFTYRYPHYGVTSVSVLYDYYTTAFSNSMGDDGFTMAVSNDRYRNGGYFFVYLR